MENEYTKKIARILKKSKEVTKKLIKDNWDVIPSLIFLYFFFKIGSSNTKMTLGAIFFIFLGIINLFGLGSFAKADKKLTFYLSILLITLGTFTLLINFLLKPHPLLFILIFVLTIFGEALFFYFYGPDSWFRYLLYLAFGVSLIQLIISAIQIVYQTMRLQDFGIETAIFIPIGFLGLIVFIHLFYWPLELYKTKSNRQINRHINKTNFGAFIFSLVISLVWIFFQWSNQHNVGEKISLIAVTFCAVYAAIFGIVKTIIKGIRLIKAKSPTPSSVSTP